MGLEFPLKTKHDLVGEIVNQIITEEHRISDEICKKLLNKYGYPNDIELHVSHDGSLRIWMKDGLEVARMKCHRNIPKSFKIEYSVI